MVSKASSSRADETNQVSNALGGAYTYSSTAEAAVPAALRRGTRPLFFNFGLGGNVDFRGYGSGFRLHQEFGGHFSGNSSGPALAIVTQEEFGSWSPFGFTALGKFLWDIQPKSDLALYISPFVSAGYHGYFGYRAGYYGYYYTPRYGNAFHFFSTQFGVALKLIINDRFLVWLQFPSVEFLANQYGWSARFLFMTGAGVTF